MYSSYKSGYKSSFRSVVNYSSDLNYSFFFSYNLWSAIPDCTNWKLLSTVHCFRLSHCKKCYYSECHPFHRIQELIDTKWNVVSTFSHYLPHFHGFETSGILNGTILLFRIFQFVSVFLQLLLYTSYSRWLILTCYWVITLRSVFCQVSAVDRFCVSELPNHLLFTLPCAREAHFHRSAVQSSLNIDCMKKIMIYQSSFWDCV